MSKTNSGNFFVDFSLSQKILHPTPKTITNGDVALYTSLYGSRFVVQSSDEFAEKIYYPRSPIDDLLVFHVVFGKTVPDISQNAIANLGYSEGIFQSPVYPGDTLTAESEVIGLKENSNRKTGIVYVRSTGLNQRNETVLTYIRWVMVRKRDQSPSQIETTIPTLNNFTPIDTLGHAIPELNIDQWDYQLSGSDSKWNDYMVGEKIDHEAGVTVEEAEHQMATRLYQNTASVHFNLFVEQSNRFGRRLIYGGHVISIARALSFNGLANAFHICGINGGQHVAPLFAGDTVFAWTEVLKKAELPNRSNIGLLRLRTIATKNYICNDFPYKSAEEKYHPNIILDFDYWVAIPR